MVKSLTPEQLQRWKSSWFEWIARDEQIPPPGDWRTWLYLAGRGAGKTRSGAEWIHEQVGAGRRRIARGKVVRAEPVSALYEQGRIRHMGAFTQLEDQMCEFTPNLDRSKPKRDPTDPSSIGNDIPKNIHHIRELTWNEVGPNNRQWVLNDLTSLTGAPPLGSVPNAFQPVGLMHDLEFTLHVFYGRNEDRHLYELHFNDFRLARERFNRHDRYAGI